MNRTELAAVWPPDARTAVKAGHDQMSPVQAIRRKCLDCSGHQLIEVKLCESVTCALWPFRAGRHPYTKGRLLEAASDEGARSRIPEPANSSSLAIGPLEASGAQGEDV
jgi:hypothetical protein